MAMEHTWTHSNINFKLCPETSKSICKLQTAHLLEDFAEYCNTTFTGSLGVSPQSRVAEWPSPEPQNHNTTAQVELPLAFRILMAIQPQVQPHSTPFNLAQRTSKNPFCIVLLYLFSSFISLYFFPVFVAFLYCAFSFTSFFDFSRLLCQVSPQHDEACHDFIFCDLATAILHIMQHFGSLWILSCRICHIIHQPTLSILSTCTMGRG